MFKILLLVIYFNTQSVYGGSNLRISFEPFRKLTNIFLNTIQPNNTVLNISRELIFNILDGKSIQGAPMDYVNKYWRPYIGYIVLIIIGVLFIILFTIVGSIFCCCRVCCKRCGAKNINHAPQNYKCKRITFNVFLFIFSSFILTGAIVAMASNFVFVDTVKPINKTDDLQGNAFYFINESFVMLDNFTVTLKQNIVSKGGAVIMRTLNLGPVLFTDVLGTFIKTFSDFLKYDDLVKNVNNFIALYTRLQSNSSNLSSIATLHQNRTTSFSSYINNISTELTGLLTNSTCSNVTVFCDNVKNQLPMLTLGFIIANINYTNDLQASTVINSYNTSDMNSSLALVISSLSNITANANTSFQEYITSFTNTINGTNIGTKLQDFDQGYLQQFSNSIKDYQQLIFSNSSDFKVANGDLYTYVSYVFYGLCGLISLILLIVLLFYIGLCYGMCGTPSFEDASRCNKGTGSGFMMAGVAISFIFGWLVMLVTMIMFITGGLLNTEVCSYMTSKDPIQLQIVDDIIGHEINKSQIKIGPIVVPALNYYQSVISRCPNESDLIKAFQIPPNLIQNISSYIFKQYVEKPVNDTINTISNYNISAINTAQLDNSIKNVSNVVRQMTNLLSNVTINELKKPVTNLSSVPAFLDSVNKLINELNNTGDNLTSTQIKNLFVNFNSSVSAMDALQQAYLNQKNGSDISILALNASLTTVVNILTSFKTTPTDARNVAVLASQSLLRVRAQEVVNRTLYDFIIAMGNCTGLSGSFNNAVNAICVVILGPYNNIWMGIGWFLLFIIPAIIFAVKLASIYRISHIESDFSAYNNAYMPSNQFLSANDLEMIRMARPQKA